MNFIQHPLVLEGGRVRLVPLEQAHFPDLVNVAKDERIWEHISINGADSQRLLQHLKTAGETRNGILARWAAEPALSVTYALQ